MKTKKAKNCVAYSDIYECLDGGESAASIAAMLNISESTVYKAKARRNGKKTGAEPKIKASLPAVSLSIQLSSMVGVCEVKLRNGTGELKGTLFLCNEGLSYRRPNQKGASDRCLTWTILDKLMLLGIG